MTDFKPYNWYTCVFNPHYKKTFYCVAIDGEYLFPTHNINSAGFSLILSRPATEQEIKEEKDLLKKINQE